MGIHGLTKLLGDNAPKCIKEQNFNNYFGRKIAVDASMHIYQFLAVVGRQGDQLLSNEAGEVTSHLQGMFYRTARMLEAGRGHGVLMKAVRQSCNLLYAAQVGSCSAGRCTGHSRVVQQLLPQNTTALPQQLYCPNMHHVLSFFCMLSEAKHDSFMLSIMLQSCSLYICHGVNGCNHFYSASRAAAHIQQ